MLVVPRADPQINIRIPAALKAKLDEASAASSRTLTGEVVRRLEDSFKADDDAMQRMEARLVALEKAVFKRGK